MRLAPTPGSGVGISLVKICRFLEDVPLQVLFCDNLLLLAFAFGGVESAFAEAEIFGGDF
jgi:hypothetical protein